MHNSGKTKFISLLAAGFGLGYLPASGTAGSVWGILLAWFIAYLQLSILVQIAFAIVLAAISVILCDVAEKFYGKKDDRRIVADEFMTFPITLIGIPWLEKPWFLAIAFVVARLLDVIKPPPARQSQRISGGLGIVADDIISNLYSLLLLHVIWRFFIR